MHTGRSRLLAPRPRVLVLEGLELGADHALRYPDLFGLDRGGEPLHEHLLRLRRELEPDEIGAAAAALEVFDDGVADACRIDERLARADHAQDALLGLWP